MAEKSGYKDDKKRPEPLSIVELRELADALINASEFTHRDAEYGSMRDLTHGRTKVEIPGVEIAVQWHSPEINTDAHLYVRRMLNAGMTVHVTAVKEGRRAEEQAARIKDYLTYLDTDWRTRGIYQPALFDTATVGVGVLHPIIKPGALPDPIGAAGARGKDENPRAYFERVKAAVAAYKGCPFDLERIDSRTLYWEADGSIQLQKAIVPVRAVNRIYAARGKYVGKEDGKAIIREIDASKGVSVAAETLRQQTVTLISAEDEHWCYRLVSGDGGMKEAEVLDVYPNYFGQPSYVRVLGDLTGESDALNFSQPWLLGKYATVRPKNLFGTVLLTGGVRSAQQRYQIVWRGEGAPPQNVGVEDIRVVGEVLDLPPGFEIVMPKIELGVDVTEALKYIETIDTFGFPRELAAPMEFDAKSGADRGKAMDAISNIMDAPLERWAEALRQVFQLVLKAQQALELDVKVNAARTSMRQPDEPARVRDEIEVPHQDLDDVDVALEFDATTQYTQIAQQEEDMKLREQGMLTDTEFLKRNRKVSDTSAWFRLRDRDEMRVFARALGLEDAKRAIENIRASVLQKAAQRAKLAPELAAAALNGAGGGAGDVTAPPPQDDMTASIPTGTGTAMSVQEPESPELPSYETAGGAIAGTA